MIRLATYDDVPAIIALGTRLLENGAYGDVPVSFSAATARLVVAIRHPDQWLGVAEHRGKIVGFMILQIVPYWWSSNRSYVLDDGIYCERPGLGRNLVRAGLAWVATKPHIREVLIALTSEKMTNRSKMALKRGCGLSDRGVVLSIRNQAEAKRWVA